MLPRLLKSSHKFLSAPRQKALTLAKADMNVLMYLLYRCANSGTERLLIPDLLLLRIYSCQSHQQASESALACP